MKEWIAKRNTVAVLNFREKTYLFLEEAGPECYLVLLHATRVSRSFRCHVVLPTTRPVFVILQVIRNELPQTETREKENVRTLERSYPIMSRETCRSRCKFQFIAISNKYDIAKTMIWANEIIAPIETHLFPRFLDHRLGFELLVGEGPGTWIEVSPRWGHRERYKRQAILYSWRVLGICRAEEEQSTMSTLVYVCFHVLDKHDVIAIQILR